MDARKRIEKQIAARRLQQKQARPINTKLSEPEDPFNEQSPKKQKGSGMNRFILQVVISGCLFFSIGIMAQSTQAQIKPVQSFVENAFEDHFQFAAVSAFFEQTFGSPLQLLPDQREQVMEGDELLDYAVPASGTIRESFSEHGQGILLEIGVGEEVKAVKGGHVIEVHTDGESGLGKTIELQHPDGTTSVYGMLDDIVVRPYDILTSGSVIGTVAQPVDEQSALFYFAIKQEGQYIDPSKVIDFD